AIPHVDALICGENHSRQACTVLGSQLFKATGVCCKVGSIHYSPLNEIETQALSLDVATMQNMTPEELNSVRLVRCVAAVKLVRRCPPVFVPIALAALTTGGQNVSSTRTLAAA